VLNTTSGVLANISIIDIEIEILPDGLTLDILIINWLMFTLTIISYIEMLIVELIILRIYPHL